MDPFKIIPGIKNKVPIVVSVPHCGTIIPADIKPSFRPEALEFVDDTDLFVDKLYDFTPEMGITMIHAIYSRWVIDLNRTPGNQPLYRDGRIITGLVPSTDFLGNPLYQHTEPDTAEVSRRTELYYHPYHRALEKLLSELKEEFGIVLLFEAHSIRQYVPTISEEKFPDLILGDNDGKSAADKFIRTALQQLKQSPFQVEHNYLFKGGHITRYFGKPENNVHALQLEMTKTNYMDKTEKTYYPELANKMRKTLRQTFEALIEVM